MSLSFSAFKTLTGLFCAGMLSCTVFSASGQATIVNGDGTTLTTNWCHDDTMHRIAGQPAGGTFSGCGVIEDNGVWYFNPAVAAAGQTASHVCSLVYTPTEGNPVSRQMTIYNPIVITFWEDSIITCDGNFYLYGDASPVGSFTRHWIDAENPDVVLSTLKGYSGTTFKDATYVFYSVSDYNGCKGSDSAYVFYRGVEASFRVSKDTICVHEQLDFNAENIIDSLGYTWHSGDGVTGSGTSWQHAYIQTGVYDAALIVNNQYCADTAIKSVVVRDFALELTANLMLADRGAPLVLQTGAGEPYRVTAWRPAELFGDQTAYNQQITADTTRTYTVVGESAYGCVDSAEVTVDVNPTVYIPSSFSPNGDGRNDFFRVVNWGDPITVTQFRVFDRWGREVWTGNGANAFTGWDGTLNGAPAEMGVYYYVFEGQLPSGVTTAQQGDVTLLR